MKRLQQTPPPRGRGVSDALADLAAARMVLLHDDVAGAGGSLLLAAEHADAEAVNFMAKEARGIVCLALPPGRCESLGLSPIAPRGDSALGGAAMVSIEARTGVSTGISAADRARTIAVAVDPASSAADLVQPGHVLPLRARPGGVLEWPGAVEAAVELTDAAELGGCTVLCQVLRDDGGAAGEKDLELFAARHGLVLLAVSEVCEQQRQLAGGVDAEQRPRMRDVMSHFATGVTVVTAHDRGGAAVGTTANAICSVSLEPPLLLACLARSSLTLGAIRTSSRFAVNILSAEQRHHSDRFAAKGADARAGEVDFADHPFGVPVLPEALATIACEVEAIHPAGDHEIVVGHARSLAHAEGSLRPLLFFRGGYSELTFDRDILAERAHAPG